MESLQALDAFPAGTRVRIEALGDCPGLRGRLCSLGLTPGTVVEIKESACGSCRIFVRGTGIVLGRGMARNVLGSAAPLGTEATQAGSADAPDLEAVCGCPGRHGRRWGRKP